MSQFQAGVGAAVTRARRRVFLVALVLVTMSLVGFVLALVFQWPSAFVLGDVPDDEVGLEDLVSGTVTSIPLAPLVLLVLGAVLVRGQRWWAHAALVVLTLLGAVFVVGGLGEVTSQNENVDRAVLVTAGLLYVAVGLALLAAGVVALVAVVQAERARR